MLCMALEGTRWVFSLACMDGQAMLWDLNDSKHLYNYHGGWRETINALVFSPNRYWLCAATGPTVKIWDLESKTVVDEIRAEVPGGASVECMSLAWSADGQTLFAGYTDNLIRVYDVDTV
eukprot:Em0002g4a